MVRIPRGVEQLLTAYLTGAIAQRLTRSPTVLRATDRILHEWDTLPQRLAGRPVPYTPRTFDREAGAEIDHGEPHDEPSPFPVSGKYSGNEADLKRTRASTYTTRAHIPDEEAPSPRPDADQARETTA
ncbi:hypothetical protein MOBT1_002937 [Malassezia obtusa]|uniref:Uncharacterized protein n=1 Tax=Malassezia obtusa TaxID=76774 RepID=A0AAF0IT54_9BASI|nr:hypothetical protein MOBT1_002937 [Malassezia obtusa]